jgi:haloacetate dehalogenase
VFEDFTLEHVGVGEVMLRPRHGGDGRSTLPADAPEHAQSSKRAMAGDVVSLMRHLGREQFAGGP